MQIVGIAEGKPAQTTKTKKKKFTQENQRDFDPTVWASTTLNFFSFQWSHGDFHHLSP